MGERQEQSAPSNGENRAVIYDYGGVRVACGHEGCEWRHDAGQEPYLDAVVAAVEAHERTHVLPEAPKAVGIWAEVQAERERAHAKHGETSMEAQPADDLLRLAILLEEVGEVAKEFNEARHEGRPIDQAALRKELVQVAAMAGAWADACWVSLFGGSEP